MPNVPITLKVTFDADMKLERSRWSLPAGLPTTNSLYGYFHHGQPDFYQKSSLLQLPTMVKNREADRFRQRISTSSEEYGAFYLRRFENPWTKPLYKNGNGQPENKAGNDNYDKEELKLPPIQQPPTAKPANSYNRFYSPGTSTEIRLPEINSIDLHLNMKDNTQVVLHAQPRYRYLPY